MNATKAKINSDGMREKLRILYLYQYFTTPRGAWSTRAYEMARRWVEKGHEVTIVTSVYDKSDLRPKQLVQRFDVDGIEVIVLNIRLSNKHGVLKRLFTFIAYALLASWYALRTPSDVVVASSGPITVGLPGLVARYFGRRPLVFEVRDLWPEGAIELGILKNPILVRTARWFERLCYRSSSAVVALSPGQSDGVRMIEPQVPVYTVPNASDLDLVDRVDPLDPLPEWAIGKQIVLYAGTIGQSNDCWQLVHAAELMKHAGRNDVVMVFLGDGKDREAIGKYVQEHDLANVVILGSRPKEEVIAWLQVATASLLVFRDLPVLSTNSPNKLFDSLAAAVPVIQNTQGWIKELLEAEKCGVTVPAADPGGIADAIYKLVDDLAFRDEMGRNARRVAEERFDRDLLAEKMRRVLLDVAGMPADVGPETAHTTCAA